MAKLDKRKALTDLKAQGVLGQDKAQEDYLERTFEFGKSDLRKGCWNGILKFFKVLGVLVGLYVLVLLFWQCR